MSSPIKSKFGRSQAAWRRRGSSELISGWGADFLFFFLHTVFYFSAGQTGLVFYREMLLLEPWEP